jgi:hypothetical protein
VEAREVREAEKTREARGKRDKELLWRQGGQGKIHISSSYSR